MGETETPRICLSCLWQWKGEKKAEIVANANCKMTSKGCGYKGKNMERRRKSITEILVFVFKDR